MINTNKYNKNEYKYVDILGTKYTIVIVNDKDSEEYEDLSESEDVVGIADDYIPLIEVLGDVRVYEERKTSTDAENISIINRIRCTMRHEIIHAFLVQSGLMQCASSQPDAWTLNEEMVDFFAIQFPKISKVYKELGILEDVTYKK